MSKEQERSLADLSEAEKSSEPERSLEDLSEAELQELRAQLSLTSDSGTQSSNYWAEQTELTTQQQNELTKLKAQLSPLIENIKQIKLYIKTIDPQYGSAKLSYQLELSKLEGEAEPIRRNIMNIENKVKFSNHGMSREKKNKESEAQRLQALASSISASDETSSEVKSLTSHESQPSMGQKNSSLLDKFDGIQSSGQQQTSQATTAVEQSKIAEEKRSTRRKQT